LLLSSFDIRADTVALRDSHSLAFAESVESATWRPRFSIKRGSFWDRASASELSTPDFSDQEACFWDSAIVLIGLG
jgi:hypothetical protein